MEQELCNVGNQKGIDFEDRVKSLLERCGFEANKTGKNDDGIDVVGKTNHQGENLSFYIQCKFYNTTLGKKPIQEVFTGSSIQKEKGFAVVITNNTMTAEARKYAKKANVEIIADIEWGILRQVYETGTMIDKSYQSGLLGILISRLIKDENYTTQDTQKVIEENSELFEEVKLELISLMDEAIEAEKEADRLSQQASKYRTHALDIQKKAILKNLGFT